MIFRWPALFMVVIAVGCHSSNEEKEPALNETTGISDAKADEGAAIDYDTTVNYTRYSEYGLVEDFNGDGYSELVSLVANSSTNEIGVRIIDGKNAEQLSIFGAGREVNGIANLRWIGSMEFIPEGFYIAPTIIDAQTGDILGSDSINGFYLKTKAIHLLPKHGHSSGIIYWSGSGYAWMHQE
ncbi:MAG: hypothetical protein K9J17_08220 [Flavobacteriales bacterium]|nr:hypothetical protein [Flavobacteriales bacterium]